MSQTFVATLFSELQPPVDHNNVAMDLVWFETMTRLLAAYKNIPIAYPEQEYVSQQHRVWKPVPYVKNPTWDPIEEHQPTIWISNMFLEAMFDVGGFVTPEITNMVKEVVELRKTLKNFDHKMDLSTDDRMSAILSTKIWLNHLPMQYNTGYIRGKDNLSFAKLHEYAQSRIVEIAKAIDGHCAINMDTIVLSKGAPTKVEDYSALNNYPYTFNEGSVTSTEASTINTFFAFVQSEEGEQNAN